MTTAGPTNAIAMRVEERVKLALSSDALTQASTAAMQLAEIRFDSEDDPKLYADMRSMAKAGLRFLDQEYRAISDPLNAALAALRARVTPQKQRIEDAITEADRRYRTWQATEKRRAENERLANEQAARDAAAAQARMAESFGEEPPPPAEFPVAPAPKPLVRGMTGRGVTIAKLLQVELVGAQELAGYAPGLLKLDQAGAKNLIRGAIAKGDLLVPENGSAVFVGIKCWYESSTREA